MRIALWRGSFERLDERSLLSGMGLAEQSPYLPPQHHLVEHSSFLSGPQAGDPLRIALDFAASHAGALGLGTADVAAAVVTDQYTTVDTGTTHVYLNQIFNGLRVAGATMNINVAADGSVINIGSSFVTGLSAGQLFFSIAPAISGSEALQATAKALGLPPAVTWTTVAARSSVGRSDIGYSQILAAPAVSLDNIPLEMFYVPEPDGGVALAWSMIVRTPDGQHWYDLGIDATSGEPILAVDWIDSLSYEAFDPPIESPTDGPRTMLGAVADPVASPYGWHDTNGQAGAEFTDTRGNNVLAQEDLDGNDVGGFRPDGGAELNFSFPLDLGFDPTGYREASIANVFYVSNWLHDVHYQYGFTELAGNFQTNNYGRGGFGNDAVIADAQDGLGINNANFAVPPDGFSPRMQLYLFNKTTPRRDSGLDNQVILHEYGHGVSTRLTGGPANSNSLAALQSSGMGEGWSDWWALMFTQKPADTKLGSYPIGTYVLGQGPTGIGIRDVPYSFDKSVDPLTYGALPGDSEVHAAGTIWASALWDMTWLLIDKYGFNPNVKAGYTAGGSNAGNVLALKLVMDALKLQPANPSFLDGRDALLLADQVLTGGANQQPIWTAFARRGMGLSASDGGNSNSIQVVEAFDTPIFDLHVLSSNPADGTLVATLPLDFTINLSQSYDPDSVSASDLQVNGTEADSFNLVDADTIKFHFDVSPVVVQGLQNITLSGGAILRLEDANTLLPYSASFRYDSLPLQVNTTMPQDGTAVTLPLTSLVVTFNEPYAPQSIGATDLQLNQGSISGFELIDGSSVSYTLAGVTNEGAFTWLMPSGAVTDLFGNPSVVTSGSLQLDDPTVALSSLVPLDPRGSLVYEKTASGVITLLGDTDEFTLQLDAGQTLSVTLTAQEALRPTLAARGPNGVVLGSALASVAGQSLVLPPMNVGTSGTYTITVGSVGNAHGSYAIRVLLGAAVEAEDVNPLLSNNTRGTAQGLPGVLLNPPGGVGRAAVSGSTDGVDGLLPTEAEPNDGLSTANDAEANFVAAAPLRYQMNLRGVRNSGTDKDFFDLGILQAGDVISISQSGVSGLRGTMTDPFVSLYRGLAAAPLIIRADDDNGTGLDPLIYRYTLPATDHYFVSATGYMQNTGTYELGLMLEAPAIAPPTGGTLQEEIEGNDTALTANDARSSWRAVTFSSHTGGDLFPSDRDFLRYQLTAGDLVSVHLDSTSSLDSRIVLIDPSGQPVAVDDGLDLGTGGDAPLFAYRVPTSGVYYLQVEASDATFGTYQAIIYLSTITAPPKPVPLVDYFAFHMDQGQSASVILAGSGEHLAFELQDSAGAPLAVAGTESINFSLAVQGFVAPAADDYYVRLAATTAAQYTLLVTTGSRFESEPNDTTAQAQSLQLSTDAWGALASSGDVDSYKFAVTSGQSVSISTSTPGDGPLDFANTLDPAIDLFDPAGQLVAGNDNGAADARNSLLNFQAAQSGTYTLRVRSAASSGEYRLHVGGASGAPAALSVIATTPTEGSFAFTPISSLTVRFSDLLLLSTLQASDLAIDGIAATGFSVIDGKTVRFEIAGPLADGLHTITLASGAVTDVAGVPSAGYSSQFTVNLHSVVTGRHIFYNNSAYDGGNPGADSSDDAAIATDKHALASQTKATFANYTSYIHGINAIVVDISRLPPADPTVDDFSFRVGNNSDVASWTAGPAPLTVAVRRGAGVNGSDRLTIIWPDDAILNKWLEVMVKVSDRTLLTAPDIFYFGNAVGEVGNNVEATAVDASDEILTRNHPHTFLTPASVDTVYDFNRDAFVNAADQIIARSNATSIATALQLITPGGMMLQGFAPPNYAAVAAALAEENSLSSGMFDEFRSPEWLRTQSQLRRRR